MANKSVYSGFNNDAITYFGLEADPYYGLVSSSNSIDVVLCTQDQTTYDKINSILTVPTEDEQTFKTKKKAFILPRCDVSQDRLKAALKEHGITVTNNYELADLIVGHDNIEPESRCADGDNIPSTLMMSKLWNYETTIGESAGSSHILNRIDDSKIECIVTPKITDQVRYYDITMNDSLYDVWMLTGMAVNLSHLIETTDLSVVGVEAVLHSSANKIVMDEELLLTLKSQLAAYGDDKALALKVIPTICYKSNYHLLWQFAHDCDQITYADNRDKDLQYWIQTSNFSCFSRRNAQEMILWLEENEKLCKTTFRYLEPIVRQEISIHNRDLYTFKVSVKKEYQQYLK